MMLRRLELVEGTSNKVLTSGLDLSLSSELLLLFLLDLLVDLGSSEYDPTKDQMDDQLGTSSTSSYRLRLTGWARCRATWQCRWA